MEWVFGYQFNAYIWAGADDDIWEQTKNLLTDRKWSVDAKTWSKSLLCAQKDISENIQHGFLGWTFKTMTYNPKKAYVFRLKQVKRRAESFDYEVTVIDGSAECDIFFEKCWKTEHL